MELRGGDGREVSSRSPPVRAASLWSASYAFPQASRAWCASSPDRVPDVRCVKPYIAAGKLAFPCGDCPACRANRRRIWTHRMMLEAFQHERSSFVTLTYSPEYVPSDGSLQPKDLQRWLKRLRKRCSPRLIRFFAVGEYGDRSNRPHYHAAVFGLGGCEGGRRVGGLCQCVNCSVVRETWPFGHVLVGELTIKSAQYITGYVAKKMTRPDDVRLDGRCPEFARMSLRPGIGAGVIPDVASVMMQWKLEEKCCDVPVAMRHGSSELPLGKYLRRLLRKQCGLDENAPPEVIEALRSGLLPVYQTVEIAFPWAKGEYKRLLVAEEMRHLNEQYGRNVAARQKKRGSL